MSRRYPSWLTIGFWICIAIAIAAVVRRAIALLHPGTGGPPQLAGLDNYFASHAALTFTHIFSALAFVVLLPFLFWRRTRESRAMEGAFFLLGAVVGATAYAMSGYTIGGWVERSAVLLFNTYFLTALVGAFVFSRRGDEVQKQRCTLRAVAILLGIATTRPVMGVFFATSPLTHLTPQQFFGPAFWIGFSINAIVIELWLRRRFATAGSSG